MKSKLVVARGDLEKEVDYLLVFFYWAGVGIVARTRAGTGPCVFMETWSFEEAGAG